MSYLIEVILIYEVPSLQGQGPKNSKSGPRWTIFLRAHKTTKYLNPWDIQKGATIVTPCLFGAPGEIDSNRSEGILSPAVHAANDQDRSL
jgi:hypothetical protein